VKNVALFGLLALIIIVGALAVNAVTFPVTESTGQTTGTANTPADPAGMFFRTNTSSMGLSNAWEAASQRPSFASSLAAVPITNHVLSYLPYYIAVVGMIGCIVLFAKPGFRAGGDLAS
jgi:hypothetical protein